MKRVSVTDLKNRLSEYLRLVKKGETIEVLERSMPIARIEGVARDREVGADHLKRLVFEGVVTQAKERPDRKLLERRPIPCKGDVAKAIIEDRGDR
jgi:prevent-host-death family protein